MKVKIVMQLLSYQIPVIDQDYSLDYTLKKYSHYMRTRIYACVLPYNYNLLS